MTDILGFHTANGTEWLSNFWPCEIQWESVTYQSTEAAFQASKHTALGRCAYISTMGPYDAMVEGRKGRPQEGWDGMAVGVMFGILMKKFSTAHPGLLEKLLATGDCRIAETNSWGDRYWGEDPEGNGKNILGRILMVVRGLRQLELIERDPSTKAHHLS